MRPEFQQDIFTLLLPTPTARASVQVPLDLSALGRIRAAQDVKLYLFFDVRTIHNGLL